MPNGRVPGASALHHCYCDFNGDDRPLKPQIAHRQHQAVNKPPRTSHPLVSSLLFSTAALIQPVPNSPPLPGAPPDPEESIGHGPPALLPRATSPLPPSALHGTRLTPALESVHRSCMMFDGRLFSSTAVGPARRGLVSSGLSVVPGDHTSQGVMVLHLQIDVDASWPRNT
jgi:hypothetical protein